MIIKFTVKKSYGDYFDKHAIDISQEFNDFPDWISEEVTNNPSYLNCNLAKVGKQ